MQDSIIVHTDDTILSSLGNDDMIIADQVESVVLADFDNNRLTLDDMEHAYCYELWRCLQLLTALAPMIEKINDSLEEVTQEEVKAMWA